VKYFKVRLCTLKVYTFSLNFENTFLKYSKYRALVSPGVEKGGKSSIRCCHGVVDLI
jgi:hypothetical protein